MKGIILAGGCGTRLYPSTLVTSKQLLPIYDKPMIYYPLATLMLAGIQDILIISNPDDIDSFINLLGDGSSYGISLQYKIQERPEGLAQSFIIGSAFVGSDSCALILGDNIFYGNGLIKMLYSANKNADNNKMATVFGYYVNDPERFGVIDFDADRKVLSIEEKPAVPKSNYAVAGLYFYPSGVNEKAKTIRLSERGEYEITDLNEIYLKEGRLDVKLLGRGFAWFDAGTPDSLLEASNFVHMIQKRQGIVISALEEIAYKNGWITKSELYKASELYRNSSYGKHLKAVAEGKIAY